jgi:hypothetical protein
MKKIVIVFIFFSVLAAFCQPVWSQSISNIRLDPATPSTVVFGKEVRVSFDYQNIKTEGLRIFVRPHSGSNPSPRYAAEGSPSYPTGSGRGSGAFSIKPGDQVIVDAVKISVYGNNGRQLFFEFFLPAKYTFAHERMVVGKRVEMMAAQPAKIRVPEKNRPQRQSRVVQVKEMPPLVGPRLAIRPDLTAKLFSRVPLKMPEPDKQVLYQQVPSIRPPDSPSGTDPAWNDQMNNWLDQLNHVLLNEIKLVVGEENTIQSLVNFEQGEQISVYDQVGLRLYFLRLTQFQRTSENPNEGND